MKIRRVDLPRKILQQTFGFLGERGSRGLESHAMWAGTVSEGTFGVSAAIFPRQACLPASYEVPEDEEFRINRRLNRRGLVSMCQVHTHPGRAFHSRADDEGSALALPGSLSVVVPDYGAAGTDDPSAWAVYELSGRRWRRLRGSRAEGMFRAP